MKECESIIIVIPILDDWESLSLLLPKLDEALNDERLAVDIPIVDDGSRVVFQEATFTPRNFKHINKISVLELKRNVGHQRAIILGLAYIAAQCDCRAVLVVDGDGEEDPGDALRLIEKCRAEHFSKVILPAVRSALKG
jgi:hypothetical protein